MNVPAYCFKVIIHYLINPCYIVVADEFSVFIIMARRERKDLIHQSDKVLCLGCEYDFLVLGCLILFIGCYPGLHISIIQRSYSDRITRRYE